MKLKLLVRYPNGSVKQELEELGEVCLKVSTCGSSAYRQSSKPRDIREHPGSKGNEIRGSRECQRLSRRREERAIEVGRDC